MNNIQKLEEQILNCWNIRDDLDILFEETLENASLDKDNIANIVLGLKGLYQLKFERLFNTFEEGTQEYYAQKSDPVLERMRETVLSRQSDYFGRGL